MTAFDNIKTNNWPTTSNDLEDFLVVKLPFNDSDTLKKQPAIKVGSTDLVSEKSITNYGVDAQDYDPNAGTQINIAASEYSTSGTVNNAGNLFDGNTATSISSADGSRIYWTPAANISVSKFEVYFTNQYGDYKIGVEVTGGSSQIIIKDTSATGNSPGWVEFSSIAGDTIGPSNQVMFRSYRSNDTDPGVLGIAAVRVNDKVVTTAEAGFPQKYYGQNCVWNSAHDQYLQVANSGELNFGTAPFCIEFWACKTAAGDTYESPLSTATDGNANGGFFLELGTQRGFFFVSKGAGIVQDSSQNPNDGAWHHWAVTRQGNTFRMFKDGTQIATASNTVDIPCVNDLLIGRYHHPSGGTEMWNGALQDLRIYKGVAKYTSNFTPPGAILG